MAIRASFVWAVAALFGAVFSGTSEAAHRRGYGHGFGYVRPYGFYHAYPAGGVWGVGVHSPFFSFSYSRPVSPRPHRTPPPSPPPPHAAIFGGYEPGRGALRTLVTPKTAAVYIDGYYAGTVHDFDGPFQKLYIVPGEHEVQIVAHGHRVYEQIVVIDPGRTLELEDVLEPLAPSGASGPPVHGSPGGAPPPPPAPSTGAEESGSRIVAPSFGRLLVRVQPPDAEVWIDGALWGSLAGMDAVTIHIGAGPHRLEIRRAGYQSFVSEVTIPAGATEALNVWLAK